MTILVFVGSLLAAMAIGIPISFALLVCGAALMWQLGMLDPQILAQNLINGANSYPLLAVPFFLLAGELMNVGGLSRRIVNVALVMVGHVKGGLGYVVIIAACLLAAMSGSAVADAAALTTLLLPMMVAAGHDKARSAGLIAVGRDHRADPAAEHRLRRLRRRRQRVDLEALPRRHRARADARRLDLVHLVVAGAQRETSPRRRGARSRTCSPPSATPAWALGLPVIIIFGLKLGVFTPTEAGVVAAVYALFVSTVVYRELKWNQLYGVFVHAARTTSVVMLLVAAAAVSAWLITVANIPGQVVALLQPLHDNPKLLMAAIMVLVMIVGTALDMAPTILILTPVLMPLVNAAGIDPVYFGVLFMINNAIGLITPPVGVVLNTVAGVGKVSMDAVTRGVVPFMIAQFILMFLMVLFPQLVMIPAHWFY